MEEEEVKYTAPFSLLVLYFVFFLFLVVEGLLTGLEWISRSNYGN